MTQAEGKYGRQALDYMRAKKVFSPDLSVPDAAFAKSIELMQKAGLADERLVANARRVLDDSYRLAALKRALTRIKSISWASFLPTLMVDARTAVRVVCGLFFLPHTIAKLRNIERASGLFDKVGLRPPAFLRSLDRCVEVVAAFGLDFRVCIRGWPRSIAATVLVVAAYAIARITR